MDGNLRPGSHDFFNDIRYYLTFFRKSQVFQLIANISNVPTDLFIAREGDRNLLSHLTRLIEFLLEYGNPRANRGDILRKLLNTEHTRSIGLVVPTLLVSQLLDCFHEFTRILFPGFRRGADIEPAIPLIDQQVRRLKKLDKLVPHEHIGDPGVYATFHACPRKWVGHYAIRATIIEMFALHGTFTRTGSSAPAP